MIYVVIDLLFASVSLLVSPSQAQIGTFRSVDTIPSHLALLALAGVALGVASLLVAWKPALPLALLFPALVVLTDLDHLPSMFGVAQPIRPAHSFVFLAATLAVTAMVIRRSDVEAIVLSAFFAHLSVDTGLFPPFSPLSFQYYSLATYRPEFIAASVVFAISAGFLMRREGRRAKP